MATTFDSPYVTPRTEIEVQVEGFSWRATLAGIAVSLAVASALHLLGAGIGLTPASIGLENVPSAGTAGIIATAWLTLATVIGFFAGGYVAGYAVPAIAQRDGCVRGTVVWAITVMLVGLIGASTALRVGSGAVQGAATVAASTVGATAAGAGAAAAQQAQQPGSGDQATQLARQAFEGMSATPAAQMSPEQAGQELTRLMVLRLRNGGWEDQDRQRAAELLARVNNTSVEDARSKVEAAEARMQQELQEAEQKAKEAAEMSARALAAATYWAFFTVGISLLAAGWGGHIGARRWVS